MNELRLILERWRAARAAGEDLVLATVVKIEGSAYRRPGTRMLIAGDGSNVGMISGGCLEGHVAKRAFWLTRAGATVVRYDTGAGEDTEWAFGLGCNGVVHVLLEPLSAGQPAPQLEMIERAQRSFDAAACAVVIAADGLHEMKVGQRMMRLPDESQHSQIGDDSFAGRISRHLADALRLRRSSMVREASATGSIDVFVEYLPPPLRLVVFGAGPDALPLVGLAKALGWYVSVVDGRPHHARAERFPLADAVLVAPPREAPAAAGVSERSAVVVMTHSYEQDKGLLRELLRSPPDYIGQLGPRSRTERMLAELVAEGAALLDTAALHYPIGLDIGGETPEEIALAIVAQIKAVLAGRPGGMLARRPGAIHD